MRDLVPPDASRRRALSRRVTDTFASFGYAPVATPPFELASVLERALGPLDAREMLRFVDGESGEVVALRPDITPQIARLVATRLRDRPPPFRLSYEGHVVRRRRGRARTERQIAQAGVELVGAAGPEADVEVLELASRALGAAGLGAHRIELNLVPLARALLDSVEAARRDAALVALAHKDRAELGRILATSPDDVRAGVLGALDLLGGREVMAAARRLFRDAASRALLDDLARVLDELDALSLGVPIGLDLGEPRGFGYYTGPSFAILAEGPGEPVALGGRYDDLLARFGHALPATGVAIDLDHLEWALGSRAPHEVDRTVVLAGVAVATLARELRAQGHRVAALPGATEDAAIAYARAWGHTHVVVAHARRASLIELDGERQDLAPGDLVAAMGSAARRSKQPRRTGKR
jgi:ATP phosphoribosyltransferase regulatory subunit